MRVKGTGTLTRFEKTGHFVPIPLTHVTLTLTLTLTNFEL